MDGVGEVDELTCAQLNLPVWERDLRGGFHDYSMITVQKRKPVPFFFFFFFFFSKNQKREQVTLAGLLALKIRCSVAKTLR